MRIALDIRQLRLGPSGDRSHLLGLLGEFAELAPEDEFLLCLDGPPLPDPPELLHAPNYHLRHLPSRPGWAWTPLVWPRMLRRERVQVAHGVYLVPPVSPCPTAVTIHDVSFMAHPEWFPQRELRRMKVLIPLSARRATRVITASEHAAGAIAEHLRVPRAKISVIPYGISPDFSPMDRLEAEALVEQKFALRPPYLLAVGLLQPRKNLHRLLEALALIAPEHPNLKLAVVGATGWGNEPFYESLARLKLQERVVLCGSVPNADLRALYSAAEMLVYPSLYEGFGIPPLEAMACGTPVAASEATSIPEVVGEAGVLFDPRDPAAMAGAVRSLLEDEALARRLVAQGLQRVRQFTWRRAAEGYLELFRGLAGRPAVGG